MSQISRSFNSFNTGLKKSELKEKRKKIYLVTPLFRPLLVTPLQGFTNNQSDSKTVLNYLTLGVRNYFEPLYVSGKLTTHLSPKLTFCRK